ncbi:MAG TPA: hypothetical protein VMV29_06985 [Ktedonobacterales bacterium]|nr:hypothetical protein [Ktedonobacterales bacterium]
MALQNILQLQQREGRRASLDVKVNACLTLALAIVFYVFFQVCKQQPALAQVNPFANDPYDAVGSFAVQLAAFSALLSTLRAFRPYPSGAALLDRRALLMRGEVVTCLCVAVTIATDAIALVRSTPNWINSSAGHALAGLVIGMAALTAAITCRIYLSGVAATPRSPRRDGARLSVAIGLSLVSALVFAVYPRSFDRGYGGAILTVIISLALFFAVVWAWALATTPALSALRDDALDDLIAPLRWLIQRLRLSGAIRPIVRVWRSVSGSALLRPLTNWLNPRQHAWNAVVLFGLVLGAYLAFAEFSGGPTPGALQVIRVALVFIGLECVGVLVGYAFFAGPLRLVRHEGDGQPDQRDSALPA